MIDSSALLADLKGQLRALQADLKERADDPTSTWGGALKRDHAEALRRGRTGLSWSAWRDNEVDQAAVAWIVATTFVRFCEDNDLVKQTKAAQNDRIIYLDPMTWYIIGVTGPQALSDMAEEVQAA